MEVGEGEEWYPGVPGFPSLADPEAPASYFQILSFSFQSKQLRKTEEI